MKELLTAKNEIILLDDEDYDWVRFYKWHTNGWGYACRNVKIGSKYSSILLHISIMQQAGYLITGNLEVDHEDRNRLNDQKYNLRVCTRSQNGANSRLPSNNKTGYRGVRWSEQANKYTVQIGHMGKQIYLGCYDDPLKAALAYNKAAKIIFGEFAYQNVIK